MGAGGDAGCGTALRQADESVRPYVATGEASLSQELKEFFYLPENLRALFDS